MRRWRRQPHQAADAPRPGPDPTVPPCGRFPLPPQPHCSAPAQHVFLCRRTSFQPFPRQDNCGPIPGRDPPRLGRYAGRESRCYPCPTSAQPVDRSGLNSAGPRPQGPSRPRPRRPARAQRGPETLHPRRRHRSTATCPHRTRHQVSRPRRLTVQHSRQYPRPPHPRPHRPRLPPPRLRPIRPVRSRPARLPHAPQPAPGFREPRESPFLQTGPPPPGSRQARPPRRQAGRVSEWNRSMWKTFACSGISSAIGGTMTDAGYRMFTAFPAN